MAKNPRKDTVEVELICPHCGYHTARTADRLCRGIKVVCANCGMDIVHESDTGDEEENETR